jgi:hypothetical protein
MRFITKKTLPAICLMGMSTAGMAATIDVEMTNLTQGMYFTPVLITTHSGDVSLFTAGETASSELQAMAEGGNIDELMVVAEAGGADTLANPAGGLLAPTTTTSGTIETTEGNEYLSLVAMILPTNDGFVGLDSWMIPEQAGVYTITLNAYDAGTEANDELRGSGEPGVAGMPVPAPLEALVGMNASGVVNEISNSAVHIHPGNIGDTESDGGISDVNSQIHRWLNPVATLTITIAE